LERNVFHINPPQTDGTDYILLISRGSGPFGSAPPVVFAVDGLSLLTGPDQNPVAFQGFIKQEDGSGKIVIQFPVDTQYLMVERKAIVMLTEIEAIQQQKEDRAEVEAAFPEYAKKGKSKGLLDELGGGDSEAVELPVEVSHPGSYL